MVRLVQNTCYYLLYSLIFFVFSSFHFPDGGKDQPTALQLNEKAPDFLLPGIDGKQYSLKDFDQSPVLVVIFTCNHCPTAQAYEDRIIDFTAKYKTKGVAVVAISPNTPQAIRLDELGYTEYSDSMEEMKMRAADKKFNFPYLYDGDTQQTSKLYGASATPHVFIFDKERKLRYKGRFDDQENPQEVEKQDAIQAVEALLAGKDIPIKETKNFGCSVKWATKENTVKNADEEWAKEPVGVTLIDTAQIRSLIKNDSGKLRLINIWATWCGPCVAEFPEFVIINRMYRNREFEFISISADNPKKQQQVLDFLKSKGAANKNYLFNGKSKYDLIEAVDKNWQGALPYTLLVDTKGKILYGQQGEIDPVLMKKKILEQIGRYYF